jgi:hypothetical protein
MSVVSVSGFLFDTGHCSYPRLWRQERDSIHDVRYQSVLFATKGHLQSIDAADRVPHFLLSSTSKDSGEGANRHRAWTWRMFFFFVRVSVGCT